METLKKARIKYKNGTSLLDLAAKLVIKVVELANKNLLSDAERVNRQILEGDVSKLKKFAPVLVEPLKNYMTLTSSFASLVASSHSATYDRKMIIKTLLKHLQEKTKDVSGKRSEYIATKINALEKHFENALDQLGVIITTVKYFSSMYLRGAAEKKNEDEELDEQELDMPEVKNLTDIAKVLSAMKKKLEAHYSEIKAIDKSVRQLVTKKGSFENMLKQQYDSFRDHAYSNLITGGVDPTEEYHLSKAYIIGGDGKVEMYVGGHLVEQNIDVKTTWLTNYQDNIDEISNDAEYAEMMNKKLNRIFGGIDESIEMCDDAYFDKLLKDCKVDDVLQCEIDNILNGEFLDDLSKYYVKHKKQYVSGSDDITSDESFKFTAEMGESTEDKLNYITNYMIKFLDALDELDVTAIRLNAEKQFKHLNKAQDLSEEMRVLNDSVEMIEKTKDLLYTRRKLKQKIREYIERALNESNFGGKFKKIAKPTMGASIEEKADYLLKREMSVRAALGGEEHTVLERASALCQAVRCAKSLISPSNKEPCICESINLVKGLVYTDILNKLLEKRFKQYKKSQESAVAEAKKRILEVGGLKDVKLYDDGHLKKEEINKLATHLVVIE